MSIFLPFAGEAGQTAEDQRDLGVSEPPKEPLALAAGDNEAGLLKQSQMAGDHGGIEPKHSGELAAAALSFSEDSKDPHPRLVGQSLAYDHKFFLRHAYCVIAHKCNVT